MAVLAVISDESKASLFLPFCRARLKLHFVWRKRFVVRAFNCSGRNGFVGEEIRSRHDSLDKFHPSFSWRGNLMPPFSQPICNNFSSLNEGKKL